MTVRWPSRSLGIASAFWLVSVLGGCGDSFDPATLDPPLRTAPAELSGVALTVGVDSARVAITDTVSLSISNTADTAVTLNGSTTCRALPELRNVSGAEVVPLDGWVCTADITSMTIPPGETIETRWPWTYLAGFTGESEGIAPGWYWLGATLSAVEFRLQAEYVLVRIPARIPMVAPNKR